MRTRSPHDVVDGRRTAGRAAQHDRALECGDGGVEPGAVAWSDRTHLPHERLAGGSRQRRKMSPATEVSCASRPARCPARRQDRAASGEVTLDQRLAPQPPAAATGRPRRRRCRAPASPVDLVTRRLQCLPEGSGCGHRGSGGRRIPAGAPRRRARHRRSPRPRRVPGAGSRQPPAWRSASPRGSGVTPLRGRNGI